MAKKGRRATREERIIAVQMMEKGYSPEEVADVLQVSRSSVFEWQRKFREGGSAALVTKSATGRATLLTDPQLLQLYTMIAGSSPAQHGLGCALWTRKLVRTLIQRKFDISMSDVTTGRILKKLGISPQWPGYPAWQLDPEKVRVWREETYPAIRAEAARLGASIFFAVEAAVHTHHHSGNAWPPIGFPAVGHSERRSVTMVSAISPRGEAHFELFEATANAERFIQFCRHLLHDITTQVFLIVDGATIRITHKVKELLVATSGRLRLHFLPPYSPELNHDEWTGKAVTATGSRHRIVSQSDVGTLVAGVPHEHQKDLRTHSAPSPDPCHTHRV